MIRPSVDSVTNFLAVRVSVSKRRLWKGASTRPLLGLSDELEDVRGIGGDGLVADDVLAGAEGAGDEINVRVVGRADDDEVDGGVGEGFVGGGEDAGVGG